MITELDVNGYRLLDQFHADFGRLTVVIGANATGKSTLLDVLQLISNCAEFPFQTALDWHGGFLNLLTATGPAQQLGWAITFTKPTGGPIWAHVPLPDRQFVYEVTISKDAAGQPVPAEETLRNARPHPGYDEPFQLLQATPTSSSIWDPRAKKLVPFDTAIPMSPGAPGPPSGQASAAAIAAQSPARQPTLLRLAQMRFLNEYPHPSWIRLLLANTAFYTGFDVGRLSALRTKPADVKAETQILNTGENLGTVLHEILTRHDYRASADALRDYLRSAYPSFFEQITTETAYGTAGKVLVRLREQGMQRAMELWDLSDGTLHFLCLAAALLNPLPPTFIALDEPEAGLHPRMLPIVADLIKTAAENTQVLVTTHSPDFLNCFELDNVAVMARDEARIVWHRPATRQTLRELLQPVTGETLGDLHRTGELEALP
jgi:predicted ATPase